MCMMSSAAAVAEPSYFSLVQLRASPAADPVIKPEPILKPSKADSVFQVMCGYNITWCSYVGTPSEMCNYFTDFAPANVKWDNFDTCVDPDTATEATYDAAVECAKDGKTLRVLRQTFPKDKIVGSGTCCDVANSVEEFKEHCKLVHVTPAPTPECAPGSCTVWGDPHIVTFDLHKKHLLQHPHREALFRTRNWKDDQVSVQEEGTFWLVKSKDIEIQGRYWRNKTHPELSSLGALAISGPFIENNVLVVRPTSGKVTWNDLEILSSMPSRFTNEFFTAQYHEDSVLVKDGRKGVGIDLYLPKGVKLTINRWAQMLAAKIDMCKEEDQDGQCGNFNGLHQDDSADEIMSRMGQKLMPDEILFERYRPTQSVYLPASEAKRFAAMKELKLNAEDLITLPNSTTA